MTGHGDRSGTLPESRPSIVPGEVIAGKYRVERVVGEGGMAYVAAATHLQLGERVALKFLRGTTMKDPNLVARFDQEARASAKLKGENVCRVIDVGQLANGAPYIVMEYLEGQ